MIAAAILGFLGTVTGMLSAFRSIAVASTIQIQLVDYGMGEAALRAFTGIHVTPAYIEGSPVPVSMRYPVRFTLQ